MEEGTRAVRLINEYYGRAEVPVGAYRGPVGQPSAVSPDWTNGGRGWYASKLVSAAGADVLVGKLLLQ